MKNNWFKIILLITLALSLITMPVLPAEAGCHRATLAG